MLGADRALEEGRAAFGRQAWGTARSAFAAAAGSAAESLSLDDFERYAIAAHLVGSDAESRDTLTRAYRAALAREDVTRAVGFAFWIGHGMIFTGELAQASGWWATARSLLTERGADCAEWGLILFTEALAQFVAGEAETAVRTLDEVEAIGRRFADQNVRASALFLRGRALIRLGRTREGLAALDEVMVALTTGELHRLLVGHTYCGLLEACWEVLDLRRAHEWTVALTRWCDAQPDLVPYRGPCLLRRVELMRLHGDWQDAVDEAHHACDWLSLPVSPETPAEAFYQLGELRRVRGEFAEAEEAYRQASRWGRSPEPGIALLWLARGQVDAAVAALRRALDERDADCGRRTALLAAYVEVLLVAGDVAAAQAATSELKTFAASVDAVFLHALPDRAEGSLLLATGQPSAAVAALRRSWRGWQQQLIAAGRTNKEIASALVISEHTVARHVQNMLQKLGCASRSGLAAFAVEHDLVRQATG